MSLYNKDIHISDKYPIIQYKKESKSLSITVEISFNIETEVGISIELNNNSTQSNSIDLGLYILPYTNEGVGFIKEIQYLSNQSFLINDSSMTSLSENPSNILCTTFNQGSIFNKTHEWEMILKANCQNQLARFRAFSIDINPSEKINSILY